MSEEEDRAARQARMSKALSTAYLSHQITQLEDQVQATKLGGQNGSGGGARKNRFANNKRRQESAAAAARPAGRGPGQQSHGGEKDHRDRLVLDSSVMIFALPKVRAMLKCGSQLVIPLEGESMLNSTIPVRSVALKTVQTSHLLQSLKRWIS